MNDGISVDLLRELNEVDDASTQALIIAQLLKIVPEAAKMVSNDIQFMQTRNWLVVLKENAMEHGKDEMAKIRDILIQTAVDPNIWNVDERKLLISKAVDIDAYRQKKLRIYERSNRKPSDEEVLAKSLEDGSFNFNLSHGGIVKDDEQPTNVEMSVETSSLLMKKLGFLGEEQSIKDRLAHLNSALDEESVGSKEEGISAVLKSPTLPGISLACNLGRNLAMSDRTNPMLSLHVRNGDGIGLARDFIQNLPKK